MQAWRSTVVSLVAAASLIVGGFAAASSAASPTVAEPANAAPTASPDSDPNDLAPRLTANTFAEPPASVRPKYRWWMPQAYTDDDELVRELEDMKESGAGGAEVAAFTMQGTGVSDQDFLDEYAWGTERWTDKLLTMLNAAADLDLGLDITVGPRWPAIVPSVNDINDPRAAQQLAFAYEFAAGGSSRTGALPDNVSPAPPDGSDPTLVAALVARCVDAGCADQTAGSRILDVDSVDEVTAKVSADGTLEYTFPGNADQTYALITFLQAPAGDKLTGLSASGPNYYLDHLSAQGLRATTDFYDEQVMTPEVQEAIKDVGRVDFYEDSLEIGNSQKWTWDFAEQWQQRRGYAPEKLLPALTDAGAQGLSDLTFFDFEGNLGDRVRTDYRQTWSDLYRDVRIKGLRRWARSYGMTTRIQPYGHPVDTADVAAYVDVPEGESLAFNHNIEDYKLLAVGAHRSGGAVVSNECCATREKVWDTRAAGATDPGNLQAVYRGYAGGVTQVVWHGYPYLIRGPEGTAAQNRWPGMTYGGNSSFAEAWGAKGGPNWTDQRAINDNLARLQLVLRQGKPKYDVAVYWQDFGMTGHGTTGAGDRRQLPSTSALAEQGYTYEYLSPAHLERTDARMEAGHLFPDSSGYRAVVLKDQDTMPLATARRLRSLVNDGLSVVVVGNLPTTTPGSDESAAADRKLGTVMASLVRSEQVVRVDDLDSVPAALRNAGVRPAASYATASSDIVSVRRTGDGTDYYYLFNQTGAPAEQTVALEGAGRPYLLDTWSGEITPIADYRRVQGRTVVDVELEAADATVIALSARRDGTFGSAGNTNGNEQSSTDAVSSASLTDWDLSVEGWSAGESGKAGDTAKADLGEVSLEAAEDGSLPAWSAIHGDSGYDVDLRDVSGVGTYTSTVTLNDAWSGVDGAYLDLGSAVDTVRVSVNGTWLPAVDQQDLRHIEVGRYLEEGENEITVRVASTLLNAVRVTPGSGASSRARSDYGLFGPVRISPYDASGPALFVETLDRVVPVADGGVNQVRVRVRNASPQPTRIDLHATVDGTAEVTQAAGLSLDPGESRTIPIEVKGRASSGTSRLSVAVTGGNGAAETVGAELVHSDDLALNATGSPYPRTFSSIPQDRYPASGTTDGDPTTFFVSGGNTPGQGPTAEDPAVLGVDLGAPTTVAALRLIGRTSYGPRDYRVQTSLDGDRWTTDATVDEAPKSGQVTSFAATRARYVRAVITDGYYTAQPGSNTQVTEFGVYAEGGRNLARRATPSASSTHSRFRVAAINDGSIAGQSDYAVWNAGNGWNDANKSTWPDTLTLTWAAPVRVSRAVVYTVDSDTNPVEEYGLRDYDVEALVDGTWTVVGRVRGNTDKATLETTFDPVNATALRISITDTNDHGYSRVVEFEAFAE